VAVSLLQTWTQVVMLETRDKASETRSTFAEHSAGMHDAYGAALGVVQVVQTLSAGVDKFLPLLRPGMALHNASGTHDIAVAEWCDPVCSAWPPSAPKSFDLLLVR